MMQLLGTQYPVLSPPYPKRPPDVDLRFGAPCRGRPTYNKEPNVVIFPTVQGLRDSILFEKLHQLDTCCVEPWYLSNTTHFLELKVSDEPSHGIYTLQDSSGSSNSDVYPQTLLATISAAMLRDRDFSRALQKQPVIVKPDGSFYSCRKGACFESIASFMQRVDSSTHFRYDAHFTLDAADPDKLRASPMVAQPMHKFN